MIHIASFVTTAVAWQNFYLLVGTAAATLVGLMFVAVTFGSNLVTHTSADTARSFLDPTLTHFVQVLFTACMMVIPSMSPTLLGMVLIAIAVLRSGALVRVFRHMREAHRIHQDIEWSDWTIGMVLPVLCHALLLLAGAAFVAEYAWGFNALALVVVIMLFNGVLGAWELLVWMAMTRAGGAPSA